MAAAPPLAQDQFDLDLSSALSLANKSTTGKTQRANSQIFDTWVTFCHHHGQQPTLSTIPSQEDKICYLLVFAHRYRTGGQTGKGVRAGTVDKALLAVGKGIADLGFPDPRKPHVGSDRNHPLLQAYLKRLTDEDDPTSRTYPVNTTIIRELPAVLDTGHDKFGSTNIHVIDLIIVAFFWLLRPAEYLESTTEEGRSQAFRFCDIQLTIDGTIYSAPSAPLNDLNSINRVTHAHLTFTDQKNAVRGELIGHSTTNDPFFCPVKALARIARHLRINHAPHDTPIHRHYNSNPLHRGWYNTKSTFVTNALRHAADSLQTTTGIEPHLLSARSLRPGGATALLCADIDSDHIKLLGRWKSDAMLRYLRIQAATQRGNYAQRMLDHGDYTFAPGVHALQDGLPNQAPADMAAVLAHHELYED